MFGYVFNASVGGTPALTALIKKLALPNGAYITNTFDGDARLSGTWLKNSTNSVLDSQTYGFNLANQRTGLTNTLGNYINYTYDLIGQVKTAIGKGR